MTIQLRKVTHSLLKKPTFYEVENSTLNLEPQECKIDTAGISATWPSLSITSLA